MKKNDIDKYFKSRSHSFNEMPSDDLWKKIEDKLTQEPKLKSNFKKTFFTMALPIIAIITVTSIYFNNNISEKNNTVISISDSIKKEENLVIHDSNKQLTQPQQTLESIKPTTINRTSQSKNSNTPIIKTSTQIAEETTYQEKIYSKEEVHVKPEYPKNINELYVFIEKRFKIPKDCPGGRISITFIVEKDGSLSNFETIKDVGYGTGTEAIRVLKECKKWEPGKQDGKTVRVQYTLPITIKPIENTDVNTIDNSPVYNIAGINVQPDFIGGKDKFYEYINQNYRIPEGCPSGKLYVTFIIEKDGSLSNIKILKWSPSERKELDPRISRLLTEEAIRVLKECPKWEPGEQNGEKVRVLYSIPITVVP